jgi:Fe2+ or Zn2+ uptake regulation protein
MQLLENIEKYGHMSVDDIYAEVIKTHPSLSLASIGNLVSHHLDLGRDIFSKPL